MLLNCALKILTKLFQLRMSTIFQGFIIEQQHDFLSGHSIHDALLLTNEVMHKAKADPENFLLLKVNTIKASIASDGPSFTKCYRIWALDHTSLICYKQFTAPLH